MNKPKFIVLEALDGVGKTTLVHLVAERLGGLAMDTPGPVLRATAPAVLDALGEHQTARALFYAASVLAAGARANEVVREGQTVVMDRYWLSTLSYARARGVTVDLTCIEGTVPPPDMTVLVTLDEEERQRRLLARGCTTADRETMDERFRERVLSEMRSTARTPALRPTVEVNLTGADPDEAVERVLRILQAQP